MLIYYAGTDGVGKANWRKFAGAVRPLRLLLGYYDLSVDSRRKWVFREVLKERRRAKK